MKAYLLHFFIITITSLRKKQQMFLMYFFPLAFYLMMGAVMSQLNPVFIDFMIPTMIVFTLMTSTFLCIPEQIVNERESGVFRGYRINGVDAWALLSVPMLSSLLHVSIVSAVITITAPLLFGAPIPDSLLNMIPSAVLTLFSFTGISLLIGVISSNGRSAVMISQLFFIPSMLIGGLMIPFDILPKNLRLPAYILPSTHSMNIFKSFAFGTSADIVPTVSAAVLAGSGAAALILARILFKWGGNKS